METYVEKHTDQATRPFQSSVSSLFFGALEEQNAILGASAAQQTSSILSVVIRPYWHTPTSVFWPPTLEVLMGIRDQERIWHLWGIEGVSWVIWRFGCKVVRPEDTTLHGCLLLEDEAEPASAGFQVFGVRQFYSLFSSLPDYRSFPAGGHAILIRADGLVRVPAHSRRWRPPHHALGYRHTISSSRWRPRIRTAVRQDNSERPVDNIWVFYTAFCIIYDAVDTQNSW